MSIRCKPDNLKNAQNALKHAKMKMAGRQKVIPSEKFGFSNLSKKEYCKLKAQGRLVEDGSSFKIKDFHQPLEIVRKDMIK